MFDPLPASDLLWGGVHQPEPLPVDALYHLRRPTVLRNYGDLLYSLPELNPLRGGVEAGAPSLEPGDSEPVQRPFVRRLVGALADPLTRCSHELDNLPLNFDHEQASAGWIRWMLESGGLFIPEETPLEAMRGIMRRIDEVYPLGRFEGFIALAEACLGRAARTVTTTGGSWLHTRLDFPGGERLTISECWHASSPDRSVGNRAVRLTSSALPDWTIRLLERAGGGFFSRRILRDEDAFTGELLIGVIT